MKIRILIPIFLFCFNQVFSQSAAHERCASFKRGMNLSNWLEATWQLDWPTATGYTKSDLQGMKDAGIHSIRLPITFAQITDTIYPYTIDTSHVLFDRIDSVIKWTGELNMNLIIDNHHGWALTNENWRSYKDRFATMWGTVANKYRMLDPEHYFFELLNEPPLAFNELDSLNLLFYTAIDSIRTYTTAHSIVVSPNLGSWGMAFNLYQPLTDSNLIYTFHTYDPIDFTHQGFTWNDPVYPAGAPFPHSGGFFDQFVSQSWTRVADWIATYNKPVFLGEFGVSEHADTVSRCNWIQFQGHKIDSLHIPWFYWDWRWDFSQFNSHTVSEDSIIDCFKYALHLYSDTVSGIHEIKPDDVKLFPNPAESNGELNVEINAPVKFTVQFYDGTGRKVFVHESENSKALIRLNLEGGIYIAEILYSNQRVFKKIMVR